MRSEGSIHFPFPGRMINAASLQGLGEYADPLVLALGLPPAQGLQLSRPCNRALEEAGLHRKLCLLFLKMSFPK